MDKQWLQDEGLLNRNLQLTNSIIHAGPELQLTIALVQADWNPGPLIDLMRIEQSYDWQLFYQLAIHHRLYPVLFTNIQKHAAEWVPAALIQALQQKYMQNTIEMLHLSGEMVKLVTELDRQNIPALMLKGPVLAELLYGDLSLRTSKDLDVLVPIESVSNAEEVLFRCGYEVAHEKPRILNDWKWRDHHASYYHPKTKIQVELHWRLNPDTGSEPVFWELWSRRQQVAVGGSTIAHTLGHNDLLLYLLSHGARHGWFRLRWLLDLDGYLRKYDYAGDMKQLARTYRAEAMLGQTLWLCSSIFNTPPVLEFTAFMKHRRAFKLAAVAMHYITEMVQLSPEPASRPLLWHYRRYTFTLMSPVQRIKFVISRLYPRSSDAKALPLPKSMHFLYFVIRPFLLVWRRIKPHSNPIRYGDAPYETDSDILKKTARL